MDLRLKIKVKRKKIKGGLLEMKVAVNDIKA